MTTPADYTPHVLVAFGGTLDGPGNEIWECTVRMTLDGGGSVVDEEHYLSAIQTPLGTWFINAANGMAAQARLTYVKANKIGADGKYLSRTTSHMRTYSGSGLAGGVAAKVPWYCSVAFTWLTANVRGLAHHGRMYPPNPTYTPGASGIGMNLISDTDRAAVAAAGKALLTVLGNKPVSGAGDSSPSPAIYSRQAAATNLITGVTADNVYDVQRRRKDRTTSTRNAVLAFP